MTKLCLNIILSLFSIIISGCFLYPADDEISPQPDEFPEEQIENYTGEIISGEFNFCPESYLEINVVQIHENPRFNFLNQVKAAGELPLEIFGQNGKPG
jgi:hypothetical protein